jgi:hypothetical protein
MYRAVIFGWLYIHNYKKNLLVTEQQLMKVFTKSCVVLYIAQDSFYVSFLRGGGTGGWIQGLMLARQACYHLSHSASPFHVGYFWDSVLLFSQIDLDHYIPICASPQSWDDGCALLHTAVDWDGSRELFVQADFEPRSYQSLPSKVLGARSVLFGEVRQEHS